MERPARGSYTFGPFRLDPTESQLTRDGVVIALAPKAFEALLLLVENAGHLVTRDELFQKLWPQTVVEDANLAKYVFTLRQALGGAEKDQSYIETVPKRGYRFVAPVRRVDAAGHPSAAAPTNPPRRRWIAGGAVALMVVGTAALLTWLGMDEPPATPGRRIVMVVLPFDNLSGDPTQEYLGDGMTEELTTQLARLNPERVGVIARSSAMTFKGQKKSIREIAGELRVDYVLEGSIRQSGSRLRVTAQLIRASDETHVLAESYDRSLSDLLGLQTDVARAVADRIFVELSTDFATRLATARDVAPEAYDAYLRGRFYWNEGDPRDLEKARQYFERALEIDPDFALAHAAMADYYSALPFYSNSKPDDVFPKAKAAVSRALELDDRLAEAHAALAYIRTYYDWDWQGAGEEFELAVALDPNNASLRHRYSRYLSSVGRVGEALSHMQRARELDPLSLIIQANVGVIHYFGREFDETLRHLQELAAAEPDFPVAHWGMGLAYEQKGEMERALAAFEKAAELTDRGTNFLASLGRAYAASGRTAEARKILDELTARAKQRYVPSYQLALVQVGLGDEEAAFRSLESAFEEHSTLLTYLTMDPRFDPLRDKPRFQALLRRLNFPDQAVTSG